MKTLNNSILKNAIILLILFTSFNGFSQRYKKGYNSKKRVEAKLFGDFGISPISKNGTGSEIGVQQGISFLVLGKTRRGEIKNIYGGADLDLKFSFNGNEPSKCIANVYTGFEVADNLIACAGVAAEMSNGFIKPGIHTSINYFIFKQRQTIALELNYYGNKSSKYSDGNAGNYNFIGHALVPTLKVRFPFSFFLNMINLGTYSTGPRR